MYQSLPSVSWKGYWRESEVLSLVCRGNNSGLFLHGGEAWCAKALIVWRLNKLSCNQGNWKTLCVLKLREMALRFIHNVLTNKKEGTTHDPPPPPPPPHSFISPGLLFFSQYFPFVFYMPAIKYKWAGACRCANTYAKHEPKLTTSHPYTVCDHDIAGAKSYDTHTHIWFSTSCLDSSLMFLYVSHVQAPHAWTETLL